MRTRVCNFRPRVWSASWRCQHCSQTPFERKGPGFRPLLQGGRSSESHRLRAPQTTVRARAVLRASKHHPRRAHRRSHLVLSTQDNFGVWRCPGTSTRLGTDLPRCFHLGRTYEKGVSIVAVGLGPQSCCVTQTLRSAATHSPRIASQGTFVPASGQ